MKINIDVRYPTSIQRTERVLEIAESFGLGLDDKEFIVIDNLELEVFPNDIIYITGQSGSGKSTILRELEKKLSEQKLKVQNLDSVQYLKDVPLSDQFGKTLKECLELLSFVGLTDAYLYTRTPEQLSDGQFYRFKLAKLIESDSNVWIADEFLAVLDRTYAKNIAYNLQKLARRLNKMVIVATTHQDMVYDLAPSLTINKKYREKIEIKRGDCVENLADFLEESTFEPIPEKYKDIKIDE